jgi:hypothetical protein
MCLQAYFSAKERTQCRTRKKTPAAIEKKRQWKRFGLALLLYPVGAGLMLLLAPAPDRTAYMRLQITLFCIFSIFGTCYFAFPSTHQHLQSWASKAHAINQSLDTPQRLYRNVAVLSLALLLIGKISPGPWMIGLLGMFAAFCIFVAAYDATRLYQSISEHVLGKAIISLVFAAASTVAYAIARQEIGDVVHVTPTNLMHSTLLMAIMTIPFLIVAAGGIVYAGSIAVLLILPFQHMAKDNPGLKAWLFAGLFKESTMKYPVVTRGFQFLFYSVLGVTILNAGRMQMLPYERQLKEKLPTLVYQFDLYHGSECKLDDGEKLAPLGDAKFLIGKRYPDGRIEFLPPIKCDELPTR